MGKNQGHVSLKKYKTMKDTEDMYLHLHVDVQTNIDKVQHALWCMRKGKFVKKNFNIKCFKVTKYWPF